MPVKSDAQARWLELDASLRTNTPHLASFLLKEDEFHSLRIMSRDDGSTLAIAKGYSADGGMVVCFGSGYGVAAALIAIDRTIQGGHWRKEKPWLKDGGGE